MEISYLLLYKVNDDSNEPFFVLEVEKDEEVEDAIKFNYRNKLSHTQRMKTHQLEIDSTQALAGGFFKIRCFGQILKSKSCSVIILVSGSH
jgi:hypothetical protein